MVYGETTRGFPARPARAIPPCPHGFDVAPPGLPGLEGVHRAARGLDAGAKRMALRVAVERP